MFLYSLQLLEELMRNEIAAHHASGGHPSAAAMSAAAAAGHHHHGSHAVSSHLHDKGAAAAEYILPTSADMNCNSNADLAAAAAAASAVHLPTLMHMGYGHHGERDRLLGRTLNDLNVHKFQRFK